MHVKFKRENSASQYQGSQEVKNARHFQTEQLKIKDGALQISIRTVVPVEFQFRKVVHTNTKATQEVKCTILLTSIKFFKICFV